MGNAIGDLQGIFETIRVRRVKNALILPWFKYHLERLTKGASLRSISLLPDLKIIEEQTLARCREFSWDDASDGVLRIKARAESFVITLESWSAKLDMNAGIKVVCLPYERIDPQIKSNDITICQKARAQAESLGADEALLLDKKQIVREGAWSNFFWIDQSESLITAKNNLLPGITRRVVTEQAKVEMRDAVLEEILDCAKEAFITQATHGVVPVIKIDKKELGRAPGEKTLQIRALYERTAITLDNPNHLYIKLH